MRTIFLFNFCLLCGLGSFVTLESVAKLIYFDFYVVDCIRTSLLAVFDCVFILFLSCCFHARVSGRTLVREFLISYALCLISFFLNLIGSQLTVCLLMYCNVFC